MRASEKGLGVPKTVACPFSFEPRRAFILYAIVSKYREGYFAKVTKVFSLRVEGKGTECSGMIER